MFRLLSLSLRFTALQRRLLQLSSLLSVLFWGSDDMRHGPALCKPQGLGESGGYTESGGEQKASDETVGSYQVCFNFPVLGVLLPK